MNRPEQTLSKLHASIQDFRAFNQKIKKTISQFKYTYSQQNEEQFDPLYAEIKQDIKTQINALNDSVKAVLQIEQLKLTIIVKHVEMTQIQINSKKRLLSNYEQTIGQMQNQIGKLAGRCTDLEMQLNQLKIKNKSLLQQFSTLTQFSNRKLIELQNQKKLHKKSSNSSLHFSTELSLQTLTKKMKNQIGIVRKVSNGQSRQIYKHKSPQKYNLLSKKNDSIQQVQMTNTSKMVKEQLSFGYAPLKKIIHQSEKRQNNVTDYQIIYKNSNDMNRRLDYLLTNLSNTQKNVTINTNLAIAKQKKNGASTEIKVHKI